MPRSSRSSGGRPAARPAAPAPSHQQSRGAHTQAAPPARTTPAGVPAPHAGQPQQPGMLANIASTAAGVGMGSVIGHGVSNMLFGGRSSEAAPVAEPQQQSYEERRMGGSCEIPAKDFTQCLKATGSDMNACKFYLEQLTQCQQAASQY
ncbi:BQ5605_C001g00242 [Microbotryum silenes-dioicae]|uniref:BQ5605_C001g00242 protein n=1 Tax=Microbotryum silenes-dioicae TaxID=796604 RepID=A0A2X0MQ49_9BASI|nr:BQ5605_C001g00242 [Microbotryum silenes-dioicae]